MPRSPPNVTEWISTLHERLVLRHPIATLAICTLVVSFFAWHARDFSLDATADSLTLEYDEDLNYYRMVRARYGSDDYLIVTFSPKDELFSEPVLQRLLMLRSDLVALGGVESVVSILDVPLIKSPPVDLKQIEKGLRRLENEDTDRALARQELINSALYRNLIISSDARTTALKVNLKQDEQYIAQRDLRNRLREKAYFTTLTGDENDALAEASERFEQLSRTLLDNEQQTLSAIREILRNYNDVASLHLGGVPMIVADSIDFIRHDLLVFGFAVIAFLIIILIIAFRQARWAIWSLLNCLATCIVMLGLLGMTNWHVTVVSSNFVSLLLILCLALTLHIIVRYRETHLQNPHADQRTLLRASIKRIVVPCLYTALTTMVAFGSLVVSGIRPVIDFGWMMVIGICIGFIFSFTLFPAGLMLLQPGKPRMLRDVTAIITTSFARLVDGRAWQTIGVTVVLVIVGVAGIAQLTIENRFIDYYKKSTEIYQGMELIDRALGGTTPLDVVIDAPTEEPLADEFDEDFGDEFEGIFDEDVGDEGGITSTSYWFNYPRIQGVMDIHDYLDALPETGKVISIATATRLLGELDPKVLTDNVLLSVVYKRMPDDVKKALIRPYLSEDGDQLRFSVRVFESDKSLRRNALISQIRDDLAENFGLEAGQVHLNGMLVLYNNMLQSLFRSQVLTLGAVFVAIFAMFLVL
ncbi:MAG: MMPL family transporter, partial [Gammaproteobacteria bacterium]|nr:MMPL family transporter [Gammaproteobacteria bacterium]